jgi:glutaredoxin
MKHIEVYSIYNCLDCSKYHRLVDYFCCLRDDVTYSIIDIDNERNFEMIMAKKLSHIPSTLIYEDGVLVRQAGKILSHIELFDLVYGLE